MHRWLVKTVVVCGALVGFALGQAANGGFPPAVLAAKTVAVVNDTKDGGITKGAAAALQSWGSSRWWTTPTRRISRCVSSIHMKAYTKDGDAPFYVTRTDDSKVKAGMSCVNAFHTAYRAARQQAKPGR